MEKKSTSEERTPATRAVNTRKTGWGADPMVDQLRIQNLIALGALTIEAFIPAGSSSDHRIFIDVKANESPSMTRYHLKDSDLNEIRKALMLSRVR